MEQQPDYYTLVTDVGLAKEANAHAVNQPKVQLVQMAIGDAGGQNYQPESDMVSLKHEIYRTNLNTVYTDPKHPNQLIVEAVIPSEIGGFTVREVGIIDSDGELFAIGNYPETLKPTLSNGVSKDLYIRMILSFSDTPDVQLIVDPNVVVVSVSDLMEVTKQMKVTIETHKHDWHSHNGAFQAILETQTTGPTGLHNRYFDSSITDYGAICDHKPFANENVPLLCSDLARGDFQYDFGNVTASI